MSPFVSSLPTCLDEFLAPSVSPVRNSVDIFEPMVATTLPLSSSTRSQHSSLHPHTGFIPKCHREVPVIIEPVPRLRLGLGTRLSQLCRQSGNDTRLD